MFCWKVGKVKEGAEKGVWAGGRNIKEGGKKNSGFKRIGLDFRDSASAHLKQSRGSDDVAIKTTS